MKSILCVEDNAEIRILVEASLPNHRLTLVPTLAEAREAMAASRFDLLILDLELPDGDGLKFLAETLKGGDAEGPLVMILTGRSETANQVIAFSLGADDFIPKPFDPLALRARVDAKLRRTEQRQERGSIVRVKDLVIDVPKQRVHRTHAPGNEPIQLTSIEFKLLLTFARAPDRVFSRNQLLDEVWGSDVNITDRTVDTHVGHLRRKIARSDAKIETVINEGYRLLP